MYSGQIEVRLEREMDDGYEVSVFTNPDWFEVYVSWGGVLSSENELGEPDIEGELAEIVGDEYHWENAELTRNSPDYSTKANDVVYVVEQNSGGDLLGDTDNPL